MIVVGTHLDSLPSSTRTEVISKLKKRFHELYVGRKSHSFSFPSVDPSFIVVNCYENRLIDGLRNYIYEYAMKYKLPGTMSSLPPSPGHSSTQRSPAASL